MTPSMTYFQAVDLLFSGNDSQWMCNTLQSELEGSLLQHPSMDIHDVWTCVLPALENSRPVRRPGGGLVTASGPDSLSTPDTMRILSDIATKLQGDLRWAAYLVIPKQRSFPLHRGDDRSHEGRDRYHLVVHGASGSAVRCENEAILMPEGSIWWINSRADSEIANPSDGCQIHLIFELLPMPFLLM